LEILIVQPSTEEGGYKKLPSTFKVLRALASRMPIISCQWIIDSLAQGNDDGDDIPDLT
jgi:hypothetical protein